MDIPHTEEVKLCLPKGFEFTVTFFLVKRFPGLTHYFYIIKFAMVHLKFQQENQNSIRPFFFCL